MRFWILAAGLGMMLSGCSYVMPDPYDEALQAGAPTPRPIPYPDAADQRALAPYQSPSAGFHSTGQ